MKLLLLFTLSSALCYGQHYIVNETAGTIAVIYDKPAIDTPLADRNPNDISRPKNHPKPKVLSLEEKLLQYAEECYNDSTLKEFHRGQKCIPPNNCCPFLTPGVYQLPEDWWEKNCKCPDDWCRNAAPEHWYKKYIHRKPTFEGFIEWLRKQK